jgi:hypothetical protein
MQVVSMMSKKPEVLRLIGVMPEKCTREGLLKALKDAEDDCSDMFLARVADLQQLEEAVACELIRGHHPLLSHKRGIAAEADVHAAAPAARSGPHPRPPPWLASQSVCIGARDGAAAPSALRDNLRDNLRDTAHTMLSNTAARGSTYNRTLDVTDQSAGGACDAPPPAAALAVSDPQVDDTAHQHLRARRTDPSPLQNSVMARAGAAGGAPGGAAALARRSVTSSVEDTAMGRQRVYAEGSAVDRGRGAGVSSPDTADDVVVDPLQLHAPLHLHAAPHGALTLHHAYVLPSLDTCAPRCRSVAHYARLTLASAAGSSSVPKGFDSAPKKGDAPPAFTDRLQKQPEGGNPGAFSPPQQLNIKHMNIS